MSRPNILLILMDDQRFNTLSALGHEELDTPNLDRLVAAGTAFTHASIMGSRHVAVCIPSRAMLLTGRTLFSLDREGRRIPPEHTTIPEWLAGHGYTTAHVGKWHQDRLSHARSYSTGAKIYGFNDRSWYEGCNGHWHVPVHDFDPTGQYPPSAGYHDPPLEPFAAPFETTKTQGRHSAEVFTDAAIDFLRGYSRSEAHAQSRPFFLHLAHLAPHDPRQYPERFSSRYHKDSVSLPDNFLIAHPFDNGEYLVRDELLEAHPRRPDAVRQHIADYYALIAFVDEQVGRLLDALTESGHHENTIVVFTADHGLAVGQHGLMGKQNLYDHSIRVPLILAGPGMPKGKQCDSLCHLTDLFPTLCDLVELPTPTSVDGGLSLLPCLSSPSGPIREVLYHAYRDCQRAIRDRRYKLIEYSVGGKRHTQLFDLIDDPAEINNLAEVPERLGDLTRLRELMQHRGRALGDPVTWIHDL